jgi:group I intron endonuclease
MKGRWALPSTLRQRRLEAAHGSRKAPPELPFGKPQRATGDFATLLNQLELKALQGIFLERNCCREGFRMASIYLIRNLVDGKGYVGQTVMTIARRWSGHKSDARRNDTFLYQAMRKHGIENFSITEVVSCDPSLLNDLERHYIKFYGTYFSTGHGYNLTEGGDNPPIAKGLKRTAETRARMSEAAKNRPPVSAEDRKKRSETAKRIGHMPPRSAIENARLVNTGRPRSANVTAAVIAALTGTKKSKEEIARRTATRRKNAAKRAKAY